MTAHVTTPDAAQQLTPEPAEPTQRPTGDRPPDAMTLVIPLKAKAGLELADFYDYWLNAHVTLPPRFPGISSVWLHMTSLQDSLWPAIDGVSMHPDEEDTFHGVPEATFPTMEDLQQFIGASRVQMEDGINFLSQEIGYAALGPNSATARDTTDPAPDGSDGHIRHLVFLRKRPEVSVTDFRAWVDTTLTSGLAAAPEVLKLRRHLFEELDITLDHPGVTMTKPLDRQYQAMVEVVVADPETFARFTGSDAYRAVAGELARMCAAVHPARVLRCITTKHDGRITLAGVRGVAVADLIRKLGVTSQTHNDVSREFMPPADLVRS